MSQLHRLELKGCTPEPLMSYLKALGIFRLVAEQKEKEVRAWWQNDAKYEASVWDLSGLEDAGTVSADFSGTSFLPAIVVPIPLIARTQSKACRGLSDQLKLFIVDEPAT